MTYTHLPPVIKTNGLIFKRVKLLKYKDALLFAKKSGRKYRTVTIEPCARLREVKDLHGRNYPTSKYIYIEQI